MLSILQNISALRIQNQLSLTAVGYRRGLQQLATGSRINSGSDDAAGLSISDGLNASITALTQSYQNATTSLGALQTADGALSQVTALLNRSVTLATQASNSGLTTSQASAINNEFQSLVTQINNIGNTTAFNGTKLFGSYVSAFISDGSVSGSAQLGTAINGVSATSLGLNGATLTSTTGAQAALTAITNAISTVSTQRGKLGATIQQIQAATGVVRSQALNLTSASSNITSADLASVVASNTRSSILMQTGIAALQRANQRAQYVLQLLK